MSRSRSALPATLVAGLLAGLLVPAASAQDRPSLSHHRLAEGSLALEGHDPVSYRAEGGGVPRAGSPEHVVEHAGVTWRFVDAANRRAFLADPARYEPAYGGWCAYAMAQGRKVDPAPDRFVVSGGRLFLFSSGTFGDPREAWLDDEAALRAEADAAWKRLSGEDPPAVSTRDLSLFNLEDGSLALQGHDPVAYFPVGGGVPREGRADLALEHGGVVYRFASEEHRALFRADPAAYEPAFGGWCAYAVAKSGELVEIDPGSFLIEDGRLLVFYKGWFNDTRASWSEEGGLLPEADRRWAERVAQHAQDAQDAQAEAEAEG